MVEMQQGVETRAAAARAVDAVATSGRSLDEALAREELTVDIAERALVRMLAYGTLRHYWRLQWYITQLLQRPLRKRDSVVNALLAVGLFQLTDTRIPDHAAVSQTVEAVRAVGRRKLTGLVNACLRRFQRDDLESRPVESEEASFNHPQWLIDAVSGDWPDDAPDVLRANNERAPMWLRVNAARSTAAAYLQRLKDEGIAAALHPGLDQAVRLDAPCAVAWLLDGIRGRVLDACAAPGGKSAHLKELGGDAIELTCLDIDADRLAAVHDNLQRLGLAATVLHADASNPDEWWDARPFDAVLLDAPCSATGVIRRHPDIKLLRRAADIDRLSRLQLSVIKALWPTLAPGGRLLYVSCSVLAAENDGVVGRFLEASPDARERNVLPNNNISDVMRQKTHGYQILPGEQGLDGFYYACLEKVP